MSERDVLAPMDEVLAAYNRQDWERFRAGLADDLRVADHRPPPALYDGIVGADKFVVAVKALFDLASGVSVRTVATEVVDPRAAVFQLCTTGLTEEASDFELAFNLGYVVDAGKISRLEFFADDQLAVACEHLRAATG